MRGQSNHSSRFISRFLGSSYSQKRLGEVANVFSGKTINLELENEGGPIAYLKVADLNLPENDRVVTTSSRFVTEETARTSGLVPIGATIFPKNGAAALHNKKRITSVTTCVDMNTMAVYSTSNTVIPEYLYAYLESQDLAALTLVGAIPQIRAKDVQSLVIPVPPIREQEQYVAVMHQADKSKFTNFKSRFIEMFETTVHVYEEIPITALCYTDDDIKCGPFGTQLKQSEYQENGVAVWGIPQINSGFTIAPDTFVTPEKAKRLEQFSLISGDIAMSRKGNVGQCALFPDNFEKGIIASDVVRIRVNKDLIMPQFLVYQLHNSHKVRRQILNVSDGSIMAGINVTKLKKIHVYSPPLERQKQFVSIVRQVDKSKYLS